MSDLGAIGLRVLAPPTTDVYLLLRDNKLVALGEGRFARVYLGARRRPTSVRPLGLGELIAIKFLKKDLSSEAVTKNATFRFCREALESMRARDRGLNTAVVSPLGYGRTDCLPKEDDPLLKVYEEGFSIPLRTPTTGGSTVVEPPKGVSVFGTRLRTEIDSIFQENADALAKSGLTAKDWTGDFYALDLCLMSLEELLLTPGSPEQHSSGEAMKAVGVLDAPIMLQRAHDMETLKGLQLVLTSSATGFDDLHTIVQWLHQKEYPKGESEAFRWSALMGLWLRCAAKVRDIHSLPLTEGGTGLSHRDIKPANVLVDTNPNIQVRLADLGFLSSVPEILQGNFSLASSVDEGGALPKGSRGFRAPEQMQIGEELSFGQLDEGATQVKLLKYLDQIISDGDWIRVQGTFKDGTSMTRLHRDGDNTYRLGSPFHDPPQLSKGQLIPDVSLHSDVFALGCLAYFLSSDGRNPERFWRQYLDEVALQALAAALPEWVIKSPLWMACALCIDQPAVIGKDLRAFWKAMTPERRQVLDGAPDDPKLGIPDQHYEWMLQSVSRPIIAMSSDAARIARFRNGVGENSALSRLLKDRNGTDGAGAPICFPFLVIVCLCCMRDKPGSIVRRSLQPQNGQPTAPPVESVRRTYVYATDESNFASKTVDIAVQLQQLPSFRAPSNTPLTDLGESPLDQFMRARLAAPR